MANGNFPDSPQPAQFRLITLGDAALVRLEPGGQASQVLGPGKPLALIAYLALVPSRSATRAHLVELLWPDLAPESARHALRQTVWFIRQRTKSELTERTSDGIGISGQLRSDRDDFVEAVEQIRFDRAVEIYRGHFLDRLGSCGGATFEQWLDVERYRFRLLWQRTAEFAVQCHLAAGRFRAAKRIVRRFRALAPHDHLVTRLAIQVSLAVGDLTAARAEADTLEVIADSTRRPLDLASERVIARVRSTEAGDGRLDIAHSDETVGRDREFAAATAAWSACVEGSARHVHYVGPPGIGKTRVLDDIERFLIASGAVVARVRGFPHGRQVPYSLGGNLVASVGALPGALGISSGSVASLLSLSPGLQEQFRVEAPTPAKPEPARQWITAAAELIEAVSDERPLAILIDDLHHADPDSLVLLEGTFERLTRHPLLLVTSSRPTLHAFQLNLETPEVEVQLPPLREVDAREIIRRHVRNAATESESQWYRQSRGRPGPLLALVRGSGSDAEPGPDEPASEPLSDPARRCLLACLLNEGRLSLALANHVTSGRAFDEFEPLVQQGRIEFVDGGFEIADRRGAELVLEAADIHTRGRTHRELGLAWMSVGRHDRTALVRAGRHFIRAGERDLLVDAYRRWITLSRRLHPTAEAALRPEAFLQTTARDAFATYLAARVPSAARGRRRGRASGVLAGTAGLVVGLAAGYVIGQFGTDRDPVPLPESGIARPQTTSPDDQPPSGPSSPPPYLPSSLPSSEADRGTAGTY